MSKLRRRRADRCTFPMEWGSMEKRGSRTGAAPGYAGWGRRIEKCSDWNIVLNVPTGTFCTGKNVSIEMYV
jgi:hypothetical protein